MGILNLDNSEKNKSEYKRCNKRSRFLLTKILFLFVIMTIFTGCKSSEAVDSAGRYIYYLDKEDCTVIPVLVEDEIAVNGSSQEQMEYYLNELKRVPSRIDQKAPLNLGFEVLSCETEGNTILLSVDEAYNDLSEEEEILVRYALVKTLVQVAGADQVEIMIRNTPLKDRSGKEIGPLNADSFYCGEE